MRKLVADLDVAIGVLLAVALAVLGSVGVVGSTVVGAATLLVLALVLTIFFRSREQIAHVAEVQERHTSVLTSLRLSIDTTPHATDVVRFDYPDFAAMIEASSEIWVVAGTSLRTTVGSYLHQFAMAVEGGCKAKLMCPDPSDAPLMNQAAESQGVPVADVASGISTQLGLASRLQAKGECEVRLLSHLPSAGVVKFVRPGHPSTIFVKILPFSYVSGAAPVLEIDSVYDERLFKVFDSVISRTWASGKAAP